MLLYYIIEFIEQVEDKRDKMLGFTTYLINIR